MDISSPNNTSRNILTRVFWWSVWASWFINYRLRPSASLLSKLKIFNLLSRPKRTQMTSTWPEIASFCMEWSIKLLQDILLRKKTSEPQPVKSLSQKASEFPYTKLPNFSKWNMGWQLITILTGKPKTSIVLQKCLSLFTSKI